jgi:hypothetical protein
MRRTGRGRVDGVKKTGVGNAKDRGEGRGGGDQRLFEKKSFLKKPKTSTKHC